MVFRKGKNTIFIIGKNCNGYFINPVHKQFYSSHDVHVARALALGHEEYIELLNKYNAIKIDDEYYFKKEEDCKRFIEYLEETYGLIIKLMEQ
jgi:predicted ATPase